jgi:hypothetical protein
MKNGQINRLSLKEGSHLKDGSRGCAVDVASRVKTASFQHQHRAGPRRVHTGLNSREYYFKTVKQAWQRRLAA